MKLIIGLGNPGQQYEQTRHNVGFLVIDALAKRNNIEIRVKRSLESEVGEGTINDKHTVLIKPQTFMNLSGRALHKALAKYPVKYSDVLIVNDDADLQFGDVRARAGGSSAGHHGVQSILEQFNSGAQIARVRFGIGRPDRQDFPLDEFVLQKWTENEAKKLNEVIERSVAAVENWIKQS